MLAKIAKRFGRTMAEIKMEKPSLHINAKTRDWTDKEVAEAIARIKSERPDVWEELQRIEDTTRDLRGSEAAKIERGLLVRMHPECELSEITQLFSAIREVQQGLRLLNDE
jgi:hypothetical protein